MITVFVIHSAIPQPILRYLLLRLLYIVVYIKVLFILCFALLLNTDIDHTYVTIFYYIMTKEIFFVDNEAYLHYLFTNVLYQIFEVFLFKLWGYTLTCV